MSDSTGAPGVVILRSSAAVDPRGRRLRDESFEEMRVTRLLLLLRAGLFGVSVRSSLVACAVLGFTILVRGSFISAPYVTAIALPPPRVTDNTLWRT